MTYENILFEVADGVATLTFNRPETYNALNAPMYKEIRKAITTTARDTSIRTLILTGAGKAFCSGADLTEFNIQQERIPVGDMLRAGLNEICQSLRQLEKPVICAINGVAAGAGASLTLACDFRLASRQASYVFAAFASIGIIPDAGATYLLPQLIGPSRALELMFLSDSQNRLSMDTALQYGLVNAVHEHDELMHEAQKLALRLSAMAPLALGRTKRAVYRATEHSLGNSLDYEAQLQDASFASQDFREGVMAFLEKRPAKFKGE